MFSAIFGKRRSSPVEDEIPPIPGAPKPDDSGYVMIEPAPSRGSLYPSVSGGGYPGIPAPFPQRPAPPTPVVRKTEETFHYLQGVPFTLCKELQMANQDSFSADIGQLLAVFTSRLNMSGYDYEFSVEKSVLKEC